jgi:hypothetical protein
MQIDNLRTPILAENAARKLAGSSTNEFAARLAATVYCIANVEGNVEAVRAEAVSIGQGLSELPPGTLSKYRKSIQSWSSSPPRPVSAAFTEFQGVVDWAAGSAAHTLSAISQARGGLDPPRTALEVSAPVLPIARNAFAALVEVSKGRAIEPLLRARLKTPGEALSCATYDAEKRGIRASGRP